MLGPVVVGDRVRLEPPTEPMLPTFCRWFADLEVTRYLESIRARHVPTLGMEKEWLDSVARSQSNVVWAVVVDGYPIGTATIERIDWYNRKAGTMTLIGERSQWGKGYATETIRLRTWYAFEHLNLEKLETKVYLPNEASIRALTRTGYRQYGIARHDAYLDGQWRDAWLGEVLRSEWLAARKAESEPEEH